MNPRTFREIPKGKRGFRRPRCERCWMEQSSCICDLLPAIHTRTQVVILMPWKESGKSSNTGRLAHLVLKNSRVVIRGLPHQVVTEKKLAIHHGRNYILFPTEEAQELSSQHRSPEPERVTLVVPDGTWRQSRRIYNHDTALTRLEPVKLPPGPPSVYQLRRAQQPHQLSTYEALARALTILEDQPIESIMIPAFRIMVQRSLRSRGRAF